MKKTLLLLIFIFCARVIYGQSTITIGQGSSISVGSGSGLAAGYRDGTMQNSGTFNSRQITFDPVATAASNVTNISFSANWNASSGASGYKVDVSLASNFSTFVSGYQNLDVGTTTSFSVNSGITAGTTYYYRVRAYDVDGITGYSNNIAVITAPPAPATTAATLVSETTFTANWGVSTGAAKYYVDVSTNSGFTAGSFVPNYENRDVGNVTSLAVNAGLTANTNYYYRVRAASANGTSLYSNTTSLTTAPLPPLATAAANPTQTSFSANWNASVGITKYLIDVSTDPNFAVGAFVAGWENKDAGSLLTISVNSGLSAGKTYYYRLRSSNAFGTSGYSNSIPITITPPAPVATAATTITSSGFYANWNTAEGAVKYYLTVATDEAFTSPVAGWIGVDVNNVNTFHVNSGISSGTTYYYRVTANNTSGTSGPSNIISLVTVPPPPLALDPEPVNTTTTSFIARWNTTLGATKYFLDVSTLSSFATFVSGWTNKDVADATSFPVNSGLAAGTVYYYRVRALNNNGLSDNSITIQVATIPPAPSVTAATNISTLSFSANWSPTSSATGYNLQVATDNLFNSPVAGWNGVNVGAVTTISVNSGLSAGTAFYYRVRAYNASGAGEYSGPASLITAPVAPVANASSGWGTNQFTANWATTDGATGYRLDVSTDPDCNPGTFVAGYEDLDVLNNLSHVVNSNLSPGTKYYYRVRAYNAGGSGISSNIIATATRSVTPFTSAATEITSSGFKANWITTTGATGYRLDVSEASDFSSFLTNLEDADVHNVLTYPITGLNPNKQYYYRVRAYNDYSISASSTTRSVLTAPATPALLSASPIQNGSFTANWTPSAGATGYYLDVSEINDFSTTVSVFNSYDIGPATSYVVSGLTNGTTYFYRLRAYNSGGTSPNPVAPQSATTLSAGPTAQPATNILATEFRANWGSSTGATEYRLDVSTDPLFGAGTFVGAFSDFNAGSGNFYVVDGLTAGHTYYYRVRAHNVSGEDGSSSVITVTTKPPAPVKKAASDITNNSFKANWETTLGATGYKLDVATDIDFTAPVYSNLDVGSVLSYTVTALSSGTSYFYRVKAYNTAGDGANSDKENPSTLGTVPRIPAVNPASNIATVSFDLNWVASAGATKYHYDVATDNLFANKIKNDIEVIAVAPTPINGLDAGTNYFYRVRAVNDNGPSDNSGTISVFTLPPTPPAVNPDTPTLTTFNANWGISTGATGYILDVATTNNFAAGTFVTGYEGLDVGPVNTYNVNGLTAGITYYYQVRAYNTGGTNLVSSVVKSQATTADDASPTIVTATAATNLLEQSFTANWLAFAGADGYRLQVATDPGFAADKLVAGFENLNVNAVTTYSVTGLTGGTTYYYKVKAYTTGPPETIAASSTIITALTVPAVPTAAAADNIGETGFTAHWVGSTGATGYYLEVATDNLFANPVTGFSNKYVNSALSYTVTGLTAGTQYFYRVKAKNGSGTTASSGFLSATTLPKEPTSVAAVDVQNASFEAHWLAADGATSYLLYVATNSDFSSMVDGWNGTDVGNNTSRVVAGLNSGTTYYYRVKSANNSGASISYSGSIALETAPTVPVSAPATNLGKYSFTANWTKVSGATKYFLDVATTGTFDAGTFVPGFQNLDVSDVATYPVTGLSRGITYYYQVRAFNSNGTSNSSASQSALTLPPDPAILPATGIQSTSFTAKWGTSTSATNYYLDVSKESNFASFVTDWQDVNMDLATSKLVNTHITEGTTYYYRVRAKNATGFSDYSGYFTLSTGPSTPVTIAATLPEETTFHANWNGIAGVDGYKLDVSEVPNFANFVSGFENKDVYNTTSYLVTGLTGGTTYYYRVRSYIGGRISDSSAPEISVLTKPIAPTSTPGTNMTQTTFQANWNTVSTATEYFLEVATNNNFTTYVPGYANTSVGNNLIHPIAGLTANTTYYYRISARNASGTGSVSNVQVVVTVPLPPSVNPATAVTNTTITANWTLAAGATDYYFDLATDNGFLHPVLGYNNINVGNVASLDITNLTGSSTYYYRLRSHSASGTSLDSNPITVSTLADPSGMPTTIAANPIAETGFTANWNAVGLALGYRLDVATDLGFTNFVTGYQNLDVHAVLTYPVAGLTGGTTYYYRIRSYNASGTSSSSNIITVLTSPIAPPVLAATSLTETGFTVNWAEAPSATKYFIDVATNTGFTNFVANYQNKDVDNVNTLSVTGLTGGMTYYYRVRALNAGGTSVSSGTITVLTVPAPPVAAAASGITETSLVANWNFTLGASKYYFDLSTSSTFDSFVADYENRDVNNVKILSIPGLSANTSYYYRIRAYNASGTSSNSAVILAVGLPTVSAPTLIATSTFKAHWTAVTEATKYFVDVSTASDFSSFLGGFNNVDAGNNTELAVSGCSPNTTYYYRVRAFSNGQTSGNSGNATLLTAPSAPVTTAATSMTPASFVANWNPSAGATGYKIDVATNPGFTDFFNDGSTTYENLDVANTFSKLISGIERGTTYYYRVKAYNTSASGDNSNTTSVLAAPLALTATDITQTGFTANWNNISGATKYYLDIATSPGFGPGTFLPGYENKDMGLAVSVTISGLTKNTDFYYRLRSFDGTTLSGNSNVATLATLPDVPTALPATSVQQTSFTANWHIIGGTAPKYKIDVSTDINFTTFVEGYDSLSVGNATSFSVTGLTPGTTYYYRVRAANSWGATASSNVITVLTIPANPVVTVASITQTAFTANWAPVAGVVDYRLDVATDIGFTSFVPGYNDLNVGNVNTYPMTSLLSGTNYYFRVRAVNTTGTSGNSNIVNALTIPATPITTVASITQTAFTANWALVTGAVDYRLDVATDIGFTSFVPGYNDLNVGNVNTYSMTSLLSGTNYYYRIRSVNATGTSGNSNVINVLTKPANPVVTVASITQTAFTINWALVTGAVDYRLDVATDNGFTNFVTGFNDLNVGNVNTYAMASLLSGTNYYFRIRAVNTTGTSGNSNEINVLTIPANTVAAEATAITTTGFTANWSLVTGASGYRIDIANDIAFTNIKYNDIDAGNNSSYVVENLYNNTQYYYRVRAYNNTGTSGNSNIITALIKPSTPAANPANPITTTGFTANWNFIAGITNYRLDVATDVTFTNFVTGYQDLNMGNVNAHAVTGLASGTAYYYRIRAINATGAGNNSNTVPVITLPADPVANPASAITLTSFTATWNLVNGATGYKFDMATDAGFTTFVTGYQDLNVGNTGTYSLSGLTSGEAYYYRVRAFNGTGASGNSNIIATATIPINPVTTAATVITGTGFTANWNSSYGATGYKLDVSTDLGFTTFVDGFQNLNLGAVNSYVITGLTTGTNYYYRLRAYNIGGTSINSGIITVMIAPENPTALAATNISTTTFSANWNPVPRAVGYKLDVATDINFTSFTAGLQNLDVSNVTTYAVQGLSAGTTYYYRVRSYNNSGTSQSSGTITVLTAPANPVAAIATLFTSSGFNANWNAVAGAAGYKLDVATDADFTTFATGLQNLDVNNVNTYTITGLTGGVTYYYRLRAYNTSGISGNSNTITVATLPVSPVATTATSISVSGFNANWTPSAGAAGYRLDVSTNISFSSYVAGLQDLDVSNVTTYTLTGLSGGTTYYYRLRGYNSSGAGSNSNVITTITVPSEPTAAPATLPTTTSITANWSSSQGAAGYRIDVASDNTFTSLIQNDADAGNVTSFLVSSLTSNTTYYYRVRAYNASGTSINSNIIAGTTLAEKPVLSKLESGLLNYLVKQAEAAITDSINVQTPLNAPIKLATIQVSGNYVKGEDQLTFTNAGGITSIWDNENGILTLTGTFPAGNYAAALRTVQYVNISLQPVKFNKELTIVVSNGYFSSDPLSRNIQLKAGNLPPVLSKLESAKLTFLKGLSPNRLPLTDSLSVEDQDNKYLYSATVKITEGYLKEEDNIDFTNTTALTCAFDKETGVLTISGKETAANYRSFVRTLAYRNSRGDNGTSSKKKFEFVINDGLINSTALIRSFEIKSPLETPTELSGAITSNRVELKWKDNNRGEDGYLIERSEGVNTAYIEIARIDSNSTSYNDISIRNGIKYYYRVAAYKAQLKSDYSNEINIIGIIVGISDQYGIPKDYVISQNYPNPFNPSTFLVYGLPVESKVKIEIYNSIGQLVDNLVDETKGPGYYKVRWNAGRLASGVYIYRVSALSIDGKNKFTESRRMVLVK